MILEFLWTRIVIYYVGLSSLWLWGFDFWNIIILSESKSLSHFHFHMDSLSSADGYHMFLIIPDYSWFFPNISDTKLKNYQKCDTHTDQPTYELTEPCIYYTIVY